MWAGVPDMACRGLCQESCGPIAASPVEIRLLAEHGVRIEADPIKALASAFSGAPVPDCPALVDGRCSVYDVRPTICRLWGAVPEMQCPWGCVPIGGMLPAGVGQALLEAAETATT